MKKRLLALCLAAALLLGMMPALTLSTSATSAETVTETTKVIFDGTQTETNFVVRGYNAWYPAGAYRLRASAAGDAYFGATVDLDHTKQVAVTHCVGLDGSHFGVSDGTVSLSGGVLTYNGILYTLKDSAANGGVVYALFYRHANERVGIKFIVPDGNGGITTTDLINYGVLTSTSPYYNTTLIWNTDGSVTFQLSENANGNVLGGTTVQNVTWTHEQAAIMPEAPEGFGATVHFEDYSFSGSSLAQFYLYQCDGGIVVTHTYEPAEPATMDSYFTAETLTADNVLSENSWKHADFETLGGYDSAVLVNKGTAYVALKSATAADGTAVTVKLGETEKTATFAGGAAEVAFPNAVSGYDVAAELTVNGAKSDITFAAKAIDLQGVPGESTSNNVTFNGTQTEANFVMAGYNAWYAVGAYRLRGSQGNPAYFGTTVDLDHTKQVAVTHCVGLDANQFVTDTTGEVSLSNRVLSYNGILYTLKDSDPENGGVVYALLYRHASERVGIKFIIPDGNGGITTTELINYGVFTSTSPYYNTTLIWNTDGTVTFQLSTNADGNVLGSVTTTQNVTWTHEQAAIMPEAQEGFRGTVDFVDYNLVAGTTKISQFYLYQCDGGIAVNHTEYSYIADIETTLEEDLFDAIDVQIDYENLVYLPAAIEHPYLGNVALTWSDDMGLVENGIVKTPAEDTDIVITAMVGDEIVYEAGVLVKAAEPIYGAFTSNVNAGWNLISFTQLAGSTDSVAVLATDKDTVYVAVKSASATATVILGSDEKEVEIVDGIGYAAFTNVGLSQFGDARDIKVYTDNGTLETRVILDQKQINLDKVGATTTKVTFNGTQTEANFVLNGYNAWYSVAYRLRGAQGNAAYFGTTLDLDHTKQVEVIHCVGLDANQFVTDTTGEVSLSNRVLSYNGILYTLKDSAENGGVVYALLYRHASERVGIKFIIPDGNGGITTTELINFGVFTSTAPYYKTKLIWNVDGTVTVQIVDNDTNIVYDCGTTTQNVTWTHEQAAIMPEAHEGFRGTVDFVDYDLVVGTTKISQFYLYQCDGGIVVNHSEPVVDVEIPTFHGWNIALGSDIGLNFYLNMHGKTNAMVNVSLAGDPLKTIPASEMELYAEGIYKAEANIAAVQMTEEIKVELSVYGFAIDAQTKTTTVKDYVADAKAQGLFTDAQKTLADAMLTYGAAAQNYFGYKTDALASTATPSEALLGITVNNADVAGSLTGIEAKSATLLLQERVIIRYYFAADTVDGLSFKLGEKDLTPEFHDGKGYWYVDVDVLPQNMDEIYTVTVTPVEGEGSLSVSYSCLTYLVNKAESQVTNLPALMMAMYDYYAAAEVVAGAN